MDNTFDFVTIRTKRLSKNSVQIFPDWNVIRSDYLMIRGRDFYAVWNEDTKLWSLDEDLVTTKVDQMLEKKRRELMEENPDDAYIVKYMRESSSGAIDSWHKYVTKQLRDSWKQLDKRLVSADTETTLDMYVTKKLPYSIVDGQMPAYEELMSTLYDPKERQKLEWAMGAIYRGDAADIQKFIVIYGEPGSGKGTFFNILELLFKGFCTSFQSKTLTSEKNDFALEDFKDNPVIAYDPDGKLDRIEDNTVLNTLVSHERISVNEKFKSKYNSRFNSFIFIGTNTPVKISDMKSGIIRRLIDVYPSGRRVPFDRYNELFDRIEFELGQIAYHCCEVYDSMGKNYYNKYVPKNMMQVTNDFYNFVEEMYDSWREWDCVTLDSAWEAYKQYCTDSNIKFPMNKRVVRSELKNYFKNYEARAINQKGNYVKDFYSGFIWEKFVIEDNPDEQPILPVEKSWLKLTETVSLLDDELKDNPAQYVMPSGSAERSWADNKKTLKDIDTHRLHFVLLRNQQHVVIDFDADDLETNLKAASKWPPTYAEFSKSGYKIHLHYYYDGDVSLLSPIYDDHIEQKIFFDDKLTSLRRKLSFCNSLPIAHISSGLKMKEVVISDSMDVSKIEDEKHLKNIIYKCLNKKFEKMPKTVQNVQFIGKLLDDAYKSGMTYDCRDLEPEIIRFAENSSNSAIECLRIVMKLHYCSKGIEESIESNLNPPVDDDYDEDEPDGPIAFFDCEVFPDVFIVCYKILDSPDVFGLINPTPQEIGELFIENKPRYRWIGFNNLEYDNHIIYKRYMGATNRDLYEASRNIIGGSKNVKIYKSKYICFADIFEYSSDKRSLKKWEYELRRRDRAKGIHPTVKHVELKFDWTQPVGEENWVIVLDYCKNDVVATEAVYKATIGDFKAKQILVEITNKVRGKGSHLRDKSNDLTARLVLNDEEGASDKFIVPDLSERFHGYRHIEDGIFDKSEYLSPDLFVNGHSIYRGYDPGYGGHAWAKPGIYYNVRSYDVDSMHPTTIIEENGLGPYTGMYEQVVKLRLLIKARRYDEAKLLFNGAAAPYLDNEEDAAGIGGALKIVINSLYGLMAAKYKNPFYNPKNVDNWVAKRGSLFMIDLHYALDALGVEVVHIKTDSIKVVDPSDEVDKFIREFAHEYGYNFKIEDEFEKLCLINKSTYVGLDKNGEWHTCDDEFQIPYVKKKLFTKEPIVFDDVCEIKNVSTRMYLDLNEDQDALDVLYNMPHDETMLFKEETKNGYLYHNLEFVGKVGQFVPVKNGYGGGILLRLDETTGKLVSVNNTKKKHPSSKADIYWKWMESEGVDESKFEEYVDFDYFNDMCEVAIKDINKYGDYEAFAS